jgi:hypothetical protein
VSARTSVLRPLGFFVLMVGFGLRLDTAWQGLAALLILAGGAAAGLGLWQGSAAARGDAFVSGPGRE